MSSDSARWMSRVAVSAGEGVSYPVSGDYSPPEAYPEYPFGGSVSPSNEVYPLVRRCLREFGCDAEAYGTPDWNPFGRWIKPGNRVFILTNFVVHRRPWETPEAFPAKCTHASVIRAVMDYAIIATGDANLVSFGNAPLQGCDYDRVSEETGARAISDFYRKETGAEVGPRDLRLYKSTWTNFGAQVAAEELSQEDSVAIDLGKDSWLDELFEEQRAEVRVGDYSPSETMVGHDRGRHVYLVNRQVLEADVILSVPKLKTHEKVGITCALKGTVGSIARKECLAHHRIGPPERNGDEYPKSTLLNNLSSHMSEVAADLGTDFRSNMYRVVSKVLNRLLRLAPRGVTYGAWYGNDTAWRMALDIARILRFARPDGTLEATPQRHHLGFVDGIVAGEGQGPLRPTPRHTRVVIFGPDVSAVDTACAHVMGFDTTRLRIVSKSFAPVSWPITETRADALSYLLNGKSVEAMELVSAFRPGFEPPKGWIGAVEREGP